MKMGGRLRIIIFFYILFIVDLAVFVPFQVKEFFGVQSKITNLKEEIAQYQDEQNIQKQSLLNKEKIRQDILTLKSKVVTTNDLSPLQAYISQKARENGLDVVEISSAPPREYKKTSQGTFLYLPISVVFDAYYHSAAKFFNSLEEGEYFLKLSRFSLTGGKPYHKLSAEFFAIIEK